ncbi:cation:proton antiporter [Methanogenium sp. MK-MG]|uniref:cation:proton antiporter n=1 Tax=Methanogenium sp. MK-MG TaxID=2599926 RepID=UPI0013EA43B6|nr:cation:proton antiporter [Methanogenium sp. MK-MG]KAF1078527.1 Glutathione-regulated potassium-efflux system protein KefB [Methanogenium sp. MK-MG]
MDIILQILLLLICAKLFGELVERVGYPALIGEIAAGILLGPSLLGWVTTNETLEVFADIGIIALLFVSGAEMNLKSFLERRNVAVSTAVAGVLVPFGSGILLGYLLDLSQAETLFIAIALSITSIGVSVRILVDYKQLNTVIGTAIVSAAVLDDIIGIFLLGILSAVAMQGTTLAGDSLSAGILIAIVFLVLFVLIAPRALRVIFDRARKTETHEMVYSVAIILALGSAWLSHAAGLHYSIGAFIAGLILGDQIRRDRLLFESLMDFGFGFFVTLFFASVGLLFSFTWETFLSPYIIPIIVVAIAGKIIGGYIGSVHFLTRAEALLVGMGMTPRGEIALVVAKVALVGGVIGSALFSAVTVMVIATIILTPLLMKQGFVWAKIGEKGSP